MTGERLNFMPDIMQLPQGPGVNDLSVTDTDFFFCD